MVFSEAVEEEEEMGCDDGGGGGSGDGGGGKTVDDLEAGQHHELSGETIVGVSTLRVSLRHFVEQFVGEESEGLVVIVVSRQRRRLGFSS